MRWPTIILCVAAAGCRHGFDEGVVGLAPEVTGVMISEDGALVLEDGRYDITPALDGHGYTAAWVEFPPGDRTLQLEIATVAEDGSITVAPRIVELVPEVSWVRLATGTDSYLIVYATPSETILLDVDATGQLLARHTTIGMADSSPQALPDGFVLVYPDADSVRTLRLDARGTPGAVTIVEEAIGTAPNAVNSTRLASGELIIAWSDTRSGSARNRIARVDAAGTVLGPSTLLYDTGQPQGNPLLTTDGADGILAAYDAATTFPQYLMRLSATGTPLWPQPAIVYDYPHYHHTVDVAGSPAGRLGMVWVTGPEQLLENVEIVVLDAAVPDDPVMPQPLLLSDPRYQFCYPELARSANGFGAAFAGDVEGSLGLFIVTVPD